MREFLRESLTSLDHELSQVRTRADKEKPIVLRTNFKSVCSLTKKTLTTENNGQFKNKTSSTKTTDIVRQVQAICEEIAALPLEERLEIFEMIEKDFRVVLAQRQILEALGAQRRSIEPGCPWPCL
jgi:hypothetical protein